MFVAQMVWDDICVILDQYDFSGWSNRAQQQKQRPEPPPKCNKWHWKYEGENKDCLLSNQSVPSIKELYRLKHMHCTMSIPFKQLFPVFLFGSFLKQNEDNSVFQLFKSNSDSRNRVKTIQNRSMNNASQERHSLIEQNVFLLG